MITYRSNGKLLLTAEYVVLDGAKALALPTKYGQSLTIETTKEPKLFWQSIDHNDTVWFESDLSVEALIDSFSNNQTPVSKRLFEILVSAKQLNPNFLNNKTGFKVTTKLDFPRDWGLGSSSTLINNIANWANIDPFKLLSLTFGGSGYDIACAKHNSPITYNINKNDNSRNISPVEFNPSFKDELFFVYLNQKQDSREGIERYNNKKKHSTAVISDINNITQSIIECNTISEFEKLITQHEQIISKLVDLATIKSSLFKGFSGAIKSLGAWGGDFILATGDTEKMDYFRRKGYNTIIPYTEMIL